MLLRKDERCIRDWIDSNKNGLEMIDAKTMIHDHNKTNRERRRRDLNFVHMSDTRTL